MHCQFSSTLSRYTLPVKPLSVLHPPCNILNSSMKLLPSSRLGRGEQARLNLCCFWHIAIIAPTPSFPFILKPLLSLLILWLVSDRWYFFHKTFSKQQQVPESLTFWVEWCAGGSSEGCINLSYPMLSVHWQLLLKWVLYLKASLPHRRWCWASIFFQWWSATAVGISLINSIVLDKNLKKILDRNYMCKGLLGTCSSYCCHLYLQLKCLKNRPTFHLTVTV